MQSKKICSVETTKCSLGHAVSWYILTSLSTGRLRPGSKGQISLGNTNGNEHCRTKDFPHQHKIQPNLKNTILCVNIDNMHHNEKVYFKNQCIPIIPKYTKTFITLPSTIHKSARLIGSQMVIQKKSMQSKLISREL